MSVKVTHPLYDFYSSIWSRTRDAVSGQKVVKSKGTTYLPASFSNPKDAKDTRYNEYQERAYFIGATGQAQKSMQGMIFRKPASYDVPPQVEGLFDNIDACGQSIDQFSRYLTSETEEAGRVGVLVDYQSTDSGLTKAEEQNIGARPYLSSYTAENIINWKTNVIGCQTILTLVVLREVVDDASDEFSHSDVYQYRVLRLNNGVYTQQLYDNGGLAVGEEVTPMYAGGQTINHIPFYIAGSEDNRPNPDMPLLAPLADLNYAHYQVTADHMENLYVHGQLTLGISTELDNETFKEANPNGVQVGARKGHYLGKGGSFVTATAPESSSLRVGLQDLEDQMQSLGAKFVQKGGQAETAEAARLNASAESSALDIMVSNVSDVIQSALVDLAGFLGVSTDNIEYSLNRDFFEQSLTPQLGQAITGLVANRLISQKDAIYMMRMGKIEIEEGRSVEDIQQDIASDMLDEDMPSNIDGDS